MTLKQQRSFDAIVHIVHEYANFVSSAVMVLNGYDIDGVPFQSPINTHISHAFFLNCRKLADFFQNTPSQQNDNIMVRWSPELRQTVKTVLTVR
jgi:hypothetical protein